MSSGGMCVMVPCATVLCVFVWMRLMPKSATCKAIVFGCFDLQTHDEVGAVMLDAVQTQRRNAQKSCILCDPSCDSGESLGNVWESNIHTKLDLRLNHV